MSETPASRESAYLPVGWAAGLGAGLIILAAGAYFGLASPALDPLSFGLIGGLLILAASLAGLIVVASSLGIATRKAALGLPHGSVRSLLALSILVVFVFIASWSLRDHENGPPKVILTVAAASQSDADKQAEDLRRAFMTPQYVVVEAANATSSAANHITPTDLQTATAPLNVSLETKFVIKVMDVGFVQADTDLRKQIVYVLSTLLVSVVSFYFGGKSASDATGAVGETLTNMKTLLTPASAAPGSMGATANSETGGGTTVGSQLDSTAGGGATSQGDATTQTSTGPSGAEDADCVAHAPATASEATADKDLPAASGGIQ